MNHILKRLSIFLVCSLTLAGCGTMNVPGIGSLTIPEVDAQKILEKEQTHELAMFNAKVDAAKALTPPPILEITAIKGQTMEFKGVESIKVNAPGDGEAMKAMFRRDPGTWEVVADYSLRFLSVFVNPWATLKAGKETAITQRLQIESSERQFGIQMDAFTSIAGQGIDAAAKPPLVITTTPAPVATP